MEFNQQHSALGMEKETQMSNPSDPSNNVALMSSCVVSKGILILVVEVICKGTTIVQLQES